MISPADFDSMDQKHYLNRFSECTPEELIALRRKAYWRFHLRPRIVFNRAAFFAGFIARPYMFYFWLRYLIWNFFSSRRAW